MGKFDLVIRNNSVPGPIVHVKAGGWIQLIDWITLCIHGAANAICICTHGLRSVGVQYVKILGFGRPSAYRDLYRSMYVDW